MKNLDQIKNLISLPGETNVTLKINNNKLHNYKLSQKRKIDQNIILNLKKCRCYFKI